VTKSKVFCYRIGSNVAVDRARDCLAFDSSLNRGRWCGYCKHTQTGNEDEVIVDLDSIYSGD